MKDNIQMKRHTMSTEFSEKNNSCYCCCCRGPRGPQGERGAGLVLLGSYPTLAALIAAHPTGNRGDAYAVNGTIYVWDTATRSWQPAGPVGASGLVLLGSFPTLAALIAAHPTGNRGDAYAVNGTIYIWDTATNSWQPAGPVGAQGPQGEQGEQGEQGAGLVLLGSYPTLADLIAAHPTGNTGDAYAVNGTIYIWDTATRSWQAAGPVGASGLVLLGAYPTLADLIAAHPTGNTGDAYAVNGTIYIWDTDTRSWQAAGPVGASGLVLLGAYPTLADLIAAHPTGNRGDAYAVNGTIYVWDTDTNSWQPAGSVGAQGPQGEQGEQGPAGTIEPGQELFTLSTPDGDTSVGYGASLAFESTTMDISADSGIISINSRPTIETLHLASINPVRIEAGSVGERWGVAAVGMGFDDFETIDPSTYPITLTHPNVAYKLYEGGTITEIQACFSLSAAQTDLATNVYAQLYYAPDLTSTQLQFVPGTEFLVGNVQTLLPVGTYRYASLSNLSIPVAPNSQLVLVFYCTSTILAGTVAYFNGILKFEK